ncbi:hypothetical protein [Streptomyces pinistramenti]|uniref:hypothetical protein n=1 Tax=Streptomyces pinistramenti TaxID=2884812 RepID=UPI001D0866DA|nr:hypothetical protein [Streptomyces pinistramenti]MCB5909825.1 hypothetical protein [Streptomyces pinistramenti]
MARTSRWHASPRRGESPTISSDTGEIRVPLSLFDLDAHQGDIALVLSRREAETLRDSLVEQLVAKSLTDAP